MKKNTIKRALATAAALLLGLTAGGGTTLTVRADDPQVTYSGDTATYAVSGSGNAKITIKLPDTTNADDNTKYIYKVYKVFDAVPASVAEGSTTTDTVSYSIMENKKVSGGSDNDAKAGFTTNNGMATYFAVDSAYNVTVKNAAKNENGTLNQDAVSAIQKYIASDISNNKEVADASVDKIANSNTIKKLQITGLDYGYYYITTTTGSVVTVDTTHPNAEVDDKNTVPSVDKKITAVKESSASETDAGSVDSTGKKSIARAGSVVTFQSTITVGNGATGYVFKDKLDDNLGLITEGDNAISVAYNASNSSTNTPLTATTDYTLDTTAGGTDANAYSFQILFDKGTDAAKVALTQGSHIIITYKATVKSSALQTTPAKNNAWVEYGNDPSNKNKTKPSETETYNAKIEVTKKFDGLTGTNTLANDDSAQFVLKKDNKFYKLGSLTEIKSETSVSNNLAVSWVDSADDATKLTFTKNGDKLTFVGLSDGNYTLSETKVPSGYNRAQDENFTINAANTNGDTVFAGTTANTDNLYKSTTIENKQGSVLPSTGGIGTTIFYIAGIALVIGAAVVLVNRKHKENA